MKTLHLILLFTIAAIAFGYAQQPFRVGSYNIRYAAAADVKSGNGWETRKQPLADLIKRHKFDIVGTQESAKLWSDLHELLPDYACIAHPERGQATFYRPELFDVVDTGVFWLSETPEVPSIGWDATDERVCYWIKFKEKKSGREFFFFNTHFYYRLQLARKESGPVLVRKIKEIAGDAPVICVGDFNSTTNTPQIKAVKALLRDAYDYSKTPRQGPENTNMGGGVFHGIPKNRIDYIFVSSHFQVEDYKVIADGDHYPSDHLPVTSLLSWGRNKDDDYE